MRPFRSEKRKTPALEGEFEVEGETVRTGFSLFIDHVAEKHAGVGGPDNRSYGKPDQRHR